MPRSELCDYFAGSPSVTPRYHGHTYDKSDYNPDRQNWVVPLVGAVIMGIILVILLCIRCIRISPSATEEEVEMMAPAVQIPPPIFPDAPSPR